MYFLCQHQIYDGCRESLMRLGFDNSNEYSMRPTHFNGKEQFISLSLVLLLLVSPLATISVGAATSSFDSGETVSVTENVDVWERSILPLRTDTSDAATQIPNADWTLSVENPQFDSRLNKSTLGVFTAESEVTVQFDSWDADRELDGNVHLVAARLNPSVNETSNVSEALTMLNTTDRGDINNNVSFYSADKTTLKDGKATLGFTPPESGRYVLFLALGDSTNAGLKVDSHNLSVTEQTTIVGMDYALVQQKASTVDLTTHEPDQGDTLTFDVDSSLEGEDVRHAILVYDETTGWMYQDFTLNVAGSPSNVSELANNTTLEHSVEAVGGVARIGSNVTLLGRNISGNVTGTTPNLGGLFELVGGNAVSTADPSNGGPYLNASVTARQGNPDTIEVETLDNWPGSERYRWVHVAVNETGAMQTDTGTFDLDRADISVTDASINTTEITAGEHVKITGTVENTGDWEGEITVSLFQNDRHVDSQTVTVGKAGKESSVKTVEFTRKLSESGEYTFKVRDKLAGTVTVNAKATSSGGGGGGGGSLEPPAPVVEKNQQSDGSVLADIRNGQAGTSIDIYIPSEQAARVSGSTFESVEIELQRDSSHFKVSINTFESRPSTTPTDPDGVAVKSYLQVDKQLITNEDIKQATIRFRLAKEQLSEFSSPKNVVLYRYHDGSWQTLETTYVGQDDGQYVFKAVTPGFSVFAIGEKQPDISVSGADLERSSLTIGETVQVTAEVTNDGNGEGTYTVELTVDGEVIKTEKVTVGAGETKTVTFSYTPSETGTYDVAVSGASAGQLEVTDEDQPDDTTEQPPTSTTTTPGADSGPSEDGGTGGSLIALLVLVLLGGAGGALYYFRDEVEQALEPYLRK